MTAAPMRHHVAMHNVRALAGLALTAVLAAGCAGSQESSATESASPKVERLRIAVVAEEPHDPAAFTQGFELDGQSLFEIVSRLVMVHGFSLSRQAVSKHIAVLEGAGLIAIDRVGRTTVHRLNTEALATARAWLTERTAP